MPSEMEFIPYMSNIAMPEPEESFLGRSLGRKNHSPDCAPGKAFQHSVTRQLL
jgi:hypothetical protein